jgi:hypothetical protein
MDYLSPIWIVPVFSSGIGAADSALAAKVFLPEHGSSFFFSVKNCPKND